MNFGIKKFSPVLFESARFNEANGITVIGKVNPTLGLIENCNLDLLISNEDIRVSKIFSVEDFNFPASFEIRESSLTLFLSITDGLGIEGRVDFDSELLEPAEINVEYKENIWTIGGTIGIQEGKICGVKNATISADDLLKGIRKEYEKEGKMMRQE